MGRLGATLLKGRIVLWGAASLILACLVAAGGYF
ncbi:MAG: lysozyme, partial [Mesorhizobium sp.]